MHQVYASPLLLAAASIGRGMFLARQGGCEVGLSEQPAKHTDFRLVQSPEHGNQIAEREGFLLEHVALGDQSVAQLGIAGTGF